MFTISAASVSFLTKKTLARLRARAMRSLARACGKGTSFPRGEFAERIGVPACESDTGEPDGARPGRAPRKGERREMRVRPPRFGVCALVLASHPLLFLAAGCMSTDVDQNRDFSAGIQQKDIPVPLNFEFDKDRS